MTRVFFFPSQIFSLWVFPWWHWGHCDLYSPPASTTDAVQVLRRLFLGFTKRKLEKNCLTPQEGIVRPDGLIFTAFCTSQELLIGTPGNVPGIKGWAATAWTRGLAWGLTAILSIAIATGLCRRGLEHTCPPRSYYRCIKRLCENGIEWLFF